MVFFSFYIRPPCLTTFTHFRVASCWGKVCRRTVSALSIAKLDLRQTKSPLSKTLNKLHKAALLCACKPITRVYSRLATHAPREKADGRKTEGEKKAHFVFAQSSQSPSFGRKRTDRCFGMS